MGFSPFAGPGQQQRQATTGTAGFPLVNGTPTIVSWTAPADGQLHRFSVHARLIVTSALTGGQIFLDNAGTVLPGGVAGSGAALWNANTGAGDYLLNKNSGNDVKGILGPGETVQIVQATAVTAGAGTVWAEIWGS